MRNMSPERETTRRIGTGDAGVAPTAVQLLTIDEKKQKQDVGEHQ
jgi:hypothetical protein